MVLMTNKEINMKYLEVGFPLLMVIGAFGSMVVNMCRHGSWEVSLQWVGATLLYIALTIRNIK